MFVKENNIIIPNNIMVKLSDLSIIQSFGQKGSEHDYSGKFALSGDGNYIAQPYKNRILVWDLHDPLNPTTVECKGSIENSSNVRSVCFSPNGRYIASFDQMQGNPTYVLWMKIKTEQSLHYLSVYKGAVFNAVFNSDAAFTPDSRYLVTSEIAVRVMDTELMDTESMVVAYLYPNLSVGKIVISSDGQYIACRGTANQQGHREDKIEIMDIKKQTVIKTIKKDVTNDYQLRVWALCFSPDSQKIAWGSNRAKAEEPIQIMIQNFLNQEEPTILGRAYFEKNEGADYINDLCFNPDGTLLASANGSIQLWDMQTSNCIDELKNGGLCLAFMPNGQHLVARSNSGIINIIAF